MLCRVNDLNATQVFALENMLDAELAKTHVASHFHHCLTVQSLSHDYSNQHNSPAYFQMTWVSLDDTGILGIFQAHVRIDDGFIRCIDTLVINCSHKKLVFGRDWRSFYDFLYVFCHRIELSALVPHNSKTEGISAARHLKRYDVRLLGRKRYANKNLNGEWMDQLLWDIITPKGRIHITSL